MEPPQNSEKPPAQGIPYHPPADISGSNGFNPMDPAAKVNFADDIVDPQNDGPPKSQPKPPQQPPANDIDDLEARIRALDGL